MVFVRDPQKGYNQDLSSCDAIFISVPVPTRANGKLDLKILEGVLKDFRGTKTPLFIKSTVTPGTTDLLSKRFDCCLYSMPEFLTERSADHDMRWHPILTGCPLPIVEDLFENRVIIRVKSEEAELAKYAHNCFGALKVTYFNMIYEICNKRGLNYEKVKEGMLLSKLISPHHTKVPGPDERLGYGGSCFPKDLDAFLNFLREGEFSGQKLIENLPSLNQHYREGGKENQNAA